MEEIQAELISFTSKFDESSVKWRIPFSTNAWSIEGRTSVIYNTGLHNWQTIKSVIRLYFYANNPSFLELGLKCKVPDGTSKIEVNVSGTTHVFSLSGADYHTSSIGRWKVSGNGYLTIDFRGMEKTGAYFADITDLLISPVELKNDAICYLESNDSNVNYWHIRNSVERTQVKAEFIGTSQATFKDSDNLEIPCGTNSSLINDGNTVVYKSGIHDWCSSEEIRITFYVKESIKLDMALQCKVPEGTSKIQLTVLGVKQTLNLSGTEYHIVPMGRWKIIGSGCVEIELKGVKKTGVFYADVTHLIISKLNINHGAIAFLSMSEANYQYKVKTNQLELSREPLDSFSSRNAKLSVQFLGSVPKVDETLPKWEVPFSANAWVVEGWPDILTKTGIHNWSSSDQLIRVYLHVKKTCSLTMSLKCKVPSGVSRIEVRIMDEPREYTISGSDMHLVPLGTWKVTGSGYLKIDVKGVQKSDTWFADITSLVIMKGNLKPDDISFIEDSDSKKVYWKRRGPSLHLRYIIPTDCVDHEYYYNEVTVPKGYDCEGSYFMAIGFSGGYFGIQDCAKNDRRVLFSVWSPQKTDDPDTLTDENKVLLVNKDKDVIVTSFGHEGSGSQSLLKYLWKPDVTYKFLVRGRPDPMIKDYTLFSAWFGEKASPHWKLIAEFTKPSGTGYLKSFHSFIENFNEKTGHTCRMAYYSNQWIRDKNGKWHEVTSAKMTGGDTGKDKRWDFETGLNDQSDSFYLKHCGFFDGKCNLQPLDRIANSVAPFDDLVTTTQTKFGQKLTAEIIAGDGNSKSSADMFTISISANGWLDKEPQGNEVISDVNLGNWSSDKAECHVIFYVGRPIALNLFMNCKVPKGKSVINVNVCGASKDVEIEGADYHVAFIGRYQFKDLGYARVTLKGVMKTGTFFADVKGLLIPKDELHSNPIICVDSATLSARRGPTVKLEYQQDVNCDLYYTEVFIPGEFRNEAGRVVAIGFNKGYLGIQGKDEIVFSITSPTSLSIVSGCDNLITNVSFQDEKFLVTSILKITAKDTDLACEFALKCEEFPEKPCTKYSAWYSLGSEHQGHKIAEFIIPEVKFGLQGFYSAVENVFPDQSHKPIKAFYSNQLVRKKDGRLVELNTARIKLEGASKFRMLDLEAGLHAKSEGEQCFALRTSGFMVGNNVNETVIVKKESNSKLELPLKIT